MTDAFFWIWDLNGKRPAQAFLHSGFNHEDPREDAENTEFFWTRITQMTRMAQICADFKDLEGFQNLPGFGIMQRER